MTNEQSTFTFQAELLDLQFYLLVGFLTSSTCLLLLMRTCAALKAKLTPFKGISWVPVKPFAGI